MDNIIHVTKCVPCVVPTTSGAQLTLHPTLLCDQLERSKFHWSGIWMNRIRICRTIAYSLQKGLIHPTPPPPICSAAWGSFAQPPTLPPPLHYIQRIRTSEPNFIICRIWCYGAYSLLPPRQQHPSTPYTSAHSTTRSDRGRSRVILVSWHNTAK